MLYKYVFAKEVGNNSSQTLPCVDSQPGELMYEGSGNLVVSINFTQPIAATQLCFVVGEVHSSFEITPDRQCLTNSGY